MENPTFPPEGRANLRERLQQERDAIEAFVIGARSGDAATFETSFGLMDATGTWRRAFRTLIRSGHVDESIKPAFTVAWLQSGDRMRDQVGDDVVFVLALRLFLPPYEGPALLLFRGDTFWSWERRSYGVSWSTDKEVAKGDALAARRRLGGGVLLESNAPREAIVFAPTTEHGSEQRHIVDCRLLQDVRATERLPDASLADLARESGRRIEERWLTSRTLHSADLEVRAA